MERDPRAYLWDAKEATEAILRFVEGKTFDDYAGDLMLRSAVERQFEIIGEALNQLSKIAPELARSIPDLPDCGVPQPAYPRLRGGQRFDGVAYDRRFPARIAHTAVRASR